MYFFAGEARHGDVRHWLQMACDREGLILQLFEFDLLRVGSDNDLSELNVQDAWINRLHEFNGMVNTPPCSSFSMAPWANSNGPVPVRSARYPQGFPWLSAKLQRKADVGNSLVSFFWRTMHQVHKLQSSYNITAFGEHPEDLGRVRGQGVGSTPASIWRMSDFVKLVENEWWSGGFRQDKWGAPTAKPTRALSNSSAFLSFAPKLVPQFDEEGYYVGPVAKSSAFPAVSLLRASGDCGPFRTVAAAAYPSGMCKEIADNLIAAFLRWKPQLPSAGDFLPAAVSVSLSSGIEGPGAVLRYSFSEGKCNELQDKLLKMKVKNLELLDPPSRTVKVQEDVQSLQQSGLDADVPNTPGAKAKWELVEGVDFVREGWWGAGPPIQTQKSAGRFGRPAQDGGGLCCPGRWTQRDRILPPNAAYFTNSIDAWLKIKAGTEGEALLESIVYNLLAGKFQKHPFEGELGELKFQWAKMLEEAGHSRPAGKWKRGQTIDFGFLHQVGAFLQDPDYKAMAEVVNGVRVGVGVELPRTPAVWPPKSKWPLGEFGEDPVSDLNTNYPSVKDHREELLLELADQQRRGWAISSTLKEATDKYGQVSVASLAVIMEKAGKLRTLFDGGNNFQINHRIKVQDAEQCPSALDVQAVVSADVELVRPIVVLVVDIEKAHQQIPVAEEDWRHIGCSADPMPTDSKLLGDWRIVLKTVGTYGVSSASWQWSRVASLFQRLCYYICLCAYLFRFADDFMLMTCNRGGVRFTKQVLRFIVLIGVFDIPLKWNKTRGGLKAEFIGYLFNFESLQGGLSERRCAWITGWLRKTADNGAVVTRELRAGLGRISFSSTLLRYLLPFMGPLYAWIAVSADGAAWPLPAALIIILKWLADQIELNPLVNLKHPTPKGLGKFFKADARADGDMVQIGGYEVLPGADLKACRWFSFVLTPETTPWAFFRENEAYRTIASLELFATLLCVMMFVEVQASKVNSMMFFTGVTDNQGNEALVHKNMTTKFPLYIVLLELTEQLQARRLGLDLRWQKRDLNQAADNLSNGIFEDFDLSLRLNPCLSNLDWMIMPRLLDEACKLELLIRSRKLQIKNAKHSWSQGPWSRGVKRRKVEGLRVTDPW